MGQHFDRIFQFVRRIFRAKVKSVEGSEVKLSLIQDFNEYMYPDCVRKKNVIGKVIDIAEGKVWWLLSTGMTATTTNPQKTLVATKDNLPLPDSNMNGNHGYSYKHQNSKITG